jgi:4-hydroxy-tetrahydrodipicolinate synthase
MNDGKVAWAGNFPAVVSPFTRDGEIDEQKFIRNIEILVSEGADGVVVSGSNGESWALKPDERLRLFRLAREVAGPDRTVIGGTGSILTPDVIDLTKAARDTGINGVMIMPPYYAGISRRELVAHFKAVSDEARMPIIVYNTKSTGFNVTAEIAAELADIEYVVAIKQSCPDFVQFEQTVAAVGDRMQVFTGHSATRGLAAMMVGAVGFVSSFDPHVLGREGISLYRLARDGAYEDARRVQMRTLELTTRLGAIGTGPATMKAAMNILGRPGGYPRRPVLELTDHEKSRVRTVLDELGLSAGAEAAE